MKIILLLLLFFSGTLQAKDKLADSLLAELPKAKTDSARVMLNYKLGKHYILFDAKKARFYGHTAEKLAESVGFVQGRAKALNLLGNSHLVMGEYDEAMRCHYSALKLSEQVQDTSSLIASYINLGIVYYKINDADRAIKNYHRASQLAKKVNDQLGLSKVYNNIGNVYEEKGKYRQALSFFSRAAVLQEQIGNKNSLAISLHNIGNVHLLLGQPEKGLPYLFRSVRLNEEIHNDMIRMTSLGKIAEIYQAIGKQEEALKYAQQSFDMAVKVESSKKIAEASRLLHAVYASMQSYEQAYKYLSVFTEHNRLLNTESRTRIESELTAKYETEQKELENQHLKKDRANQAAEIRHQQVTLALAAVVILLMLVLLVVLYLNRRRVKTAYVNMQEAHHLMQVQQSEIIKQKNEISLQSAVLREQNKKLENHSLFKDKVLSIISHDLRGPFGSIKAILDLSQRNALSESDVQHIFGLLSKNMAVVVGMLDNVLVWAKAQLEESGVEIEAVQLHQLAEENIQLAGFHAEKKNITFRNAIAADAVALADKERLNFVLRNLLMNAIKFSYPGGEIVIQAIDQDEKTVVMVSDKGKGISAANLARLFTGGRFTTPGTSGERGTGLGLKLCRELVENFNGTLSVASKEGAGSTFSVAMPKAALAAPVPQALA
ncbi:tetratricopeptide repeat-containing sensor histidine kinase [Botryobacter ruber]|uniref:tetratricopeptide repeat-containing sensor histidine kinase n=1 Tax=Botryobacter ruber TaxID=2171629 RepID=UPI000E0B8D75|nr:tetratricopeptide repeat protein [Botryobacter ruber]